MSFLRYSAKNIIITILSLLFSLLIAAGCVYFYMVLKLPDVETLKDYRLQTPLRIYTNDGQLIGEYGAMRRNPVPLNQVPKELVAGIIATEDQRFFEHPGVDIVGIFRAARELLVTGQKSQGASTITMQVARNVFLTPEKTFTRKINEILLALKINSTFSKEKILELYLNKIYLGQHAYGVSSAAAIYYGKELNELTLAEMAMIAGLPQAPSKENPITNPTAAKIRRDHVLQRMLETGYIDEKAYDQAMKAPIETFYHGPKITVNAPHMAEMVRNVIFQQFGEEAYINGLQVFTTLDSRMQEEANSAMRDGLLAFERRHSGYRGPEKNIGPLPKKIETWQNILSNMPSVGDLMPAVVVATNGGTAKVLLANGWTVSVANPRERRSLKVGDIIRLMQRNGKWEITQVPKVEGALVALDTDNGAILALNGGMNEADVGFNRAIQAQRQPGSSFKPFIYAAALSKGYTLATVVNDAPLAINDTGDPNKYWSPQNDSGRFYGPTRLREGLVHSINVMTVRLLQMVGIPYTVDYLTRFGFERKSLPPYLSLALGTAQETPMQMAEAYAVFANGGYRVTPFFIKQIQSADGKVLYNANPPVVPAPGVKPTGPVAPQVIEPDVAFLITDALQDVIRRGTGYAASVLKRDDLAGKTGTTQRMVDAWFSGYNRHLVTTVWVGYDQQTKSLNEHGAAAALPIWIEFMRGALQNKPLEALKQPEDIVSARIDPYTGQLSDGDQDDGFFEMFSPRSVPEPSSASDPEVETNDTNYSTGDNSDARLF